MLLGLILPHMLPVPMTRSMSLLMQQLYYTTTGGGSIGLLGLIIVIILDGERHSFQLMLLAILIILCGTVGGLLLNIIRQNPEFEAKSINYVFPSVLLVAAVLMAVDFVIELKYRYDVLYFPYF